MYLKQCNIKLQVNYEHSILNSISSGFTFSSAFSKELDIENIYISLPGETIIFKTDQIEIHESDLYSIFQEKTWDEFEYENLLELGKEEIYNNIYAVFNSEHFKKVIVDISGGFDTRAIFAAANSLPKYLRKKITTFTRSSHVVDDQEKAYGLTNIYNYQAVCKPDIDDSDIYYGSYLNVSQISRTLGIYSDATYTFFNKILVPNQVELMGGGGDMQSGFWRVYGWIPKISLDNDQELINSLEKDICNINQIKPTMNKYINDILDRFKDIDNFKKLHILYLLFRNRCHFNNSHNTYGYTPCIIVLQSKKLLMSKWLFFNKYKNNFIPPDKVSVDLIYKFDNVLASMPFAKDSTYHLPPKDLWSQNLDISFVTNNSKRKEMPIENIIDNINVLDTIKSKTFIPYTKKVKSFFCRRDLIEQYILHIYDFSEKHRQACFHMYKFINNIFQIIFL